MNIEHAYKLNVFVYQDVTYTIKIKNSEHTIIITTPTQSSKSNIHVGEYRPQSKKKTQQKKLVEVVAPTNIFLM